MESVGLTWSLFSFLLYSFPVGVELQKSDAVSPSYVDLETDIGRVELPLPGPRSDAAYPSYRVTVATDAPMNMESATLSVQFKDKKNQSDIIRLNERQPLDPSNHEIIAEFLLYGIPVLGKVSHVTAIEEKADRYACISWTKWSFVSTASIRTLIGIGKVSRSSIIWQKSTMPVVSIVAISLALIN